MESGNVKVNSGSFTCVAVVTDAVGRGVAFNYFNWPESPGNAIVSRVPDPITNRYRFKVASARVRRIGESPFKRSLTTMSFAPRHVA